MRRHRNLVAAAVALGIPLVVAALGGPARVERGTPAGTAGMRIEIDPATGALRSTTVAAPAGPAVSTSARGLVEKPSPRGGVMVDLQGRFRSTVTAHVGANGKVTTECHTGGAER
jgi:hypothetical protein